jgi:hypothetical protein
MLSKIPSKMSFAFLLVKIFGGEAFNDTFPYSAHRAREEEWALIVRCGVEYHLESYNKFGRRKESKNPNPNPLLT